MKLIHLYKFYGNCVAPWEAILDRGLFEHRIELKWRLRNVNLMVSFIIRFDCIFIGGYFKKVLDLLTNQYDYVHTASILFFRCK